MLKIITAIAFFVCSLLPPQNEKKSQFCFGLKVSKWKGVATKSMDKTIELFATFKPETLFSKMEI